MASIVSCYASGSVHSAQPSSAIAHANNEESSPSFRAFPKLPMELRLMIWKLALRPGRTLKFNRHIQPRRARELWRTWPPLRDEISVDGPFPTALLQVNHESRQEALRCYVWFSGPWNGKPLFINFDEDTLNFKTTDDFALACGYDFGGLPMEDMNENAVTFQQMIQHISFGTRLYQYGILHRMSALKSITIAIRSDFLLCWERSDGNMIHTFFNNKNDVAIKSQLVDSWIGVKRGLWTGPVDKLPTVHITRPTPSRRQKPSSGRRFCKLLSVRKLTSGTH